MLTSGYKFFNDIGDIDEAERLVRRVLAISGPENFTDYTAGAYSDLGIILGTRGDLDGDDVPQGAGG